MFQKIKSKLISGATRAKKALCHPGRMQMLMMMLMVGTVAFAQNTAGDYSAGTTALGTVTTEIAKYIPVVVKLCYAIAGVVAVVGAISVYIKMILPLHRNYINMFFAPTKPLKIQSI